MKLKGREIMFFLLIFHLFTLTQSRTYTPGTYKPNAHGSDACRWSNSLWTRTRDRYTQGRASLNVWSAQCQGLRRRQHRTEHKGHTPNPRTEIKIHDPAGNRIRAVAQREIFRISWPKFKTKNFRN